MNQQRADELYENYRRAPMFERKSIITSVTPDEFAVIKAKWDTMSGTSCWMDAFFTFMTPSKLPPYMRSRQTTA